MKTFKILWNDSAKKCMTDLVYAERTGHNYGLIRAVG